MAFDGLCVFALVNEFREKLINQKIYKIAQPESDELLITFRTKAGYERLLMSSDASLPLCYLAKDNKTAPMTAPNFCMLLRKHIQNGRIVEITQPSLERIIVFEIEHLDEMGDIKRKKLIMELMGKHSNIIFTDENDVIIDSIKHINSFVSSVREVLPGRNYFIPDSNNKLNPFLMDFDAFKTAIKSKPLDITKAIYSSVTGLSPLMSNEILVRSGIDSEQSSSNLDDDTILHLFNCIKWIIEDISSFNFTPNIVLNADGNVVEFAPFRLKTYDSYNIKQYDTMSDVLFDFYSKKAVSSRVKQKTADIRKILQTILERNIKKYDLQLKQLKDSEKKDKYKVYGELINAFGYNLSEGAKSLTCDNYYTNEEITIPLDETLSAKDNAKKYFDKYNKLKRTEEAVSVQAEETKSEIDHLESILASLDNALSEAEINEIKEEMASSGYIKRKGSNKRKDASKSAPLHYVSSDGFDIYVGKNNFQNDYLTFKLANNGDWWFHAKKIPGSHVILRTEGKEVSDKTFEEAAALAGFYSKGRNQEKVEIDYVKKKEIKKPQGSAPGFVVYYTNYSMVISPDISSIKQID